MFFRFIKILPTAFLARPGLSKVTRRSPWSNSANSSKPLFPNSCFIRGKTRIQQNKKNIGAKRILTLLAEATIKTAAKDKMCETRTSISLLMRCFVTTLAINHLFSATVVGFERLLQWSTLRKLWTILFLLFPYVGSMLFKNKNKLAPILTSKSNDEKIDASKKTQPMLLISWNWCEWWEWFQKPLKILHLSWYRFYLTEKYFRVDLVADCYFENFIKAAEKAKSDSAIKMIIKITKIKSS